MCVGLVPNDPWKYARKKPAVIQFREPFAESKWFDPDKKEWVNVEKIETKEGTLYAICGRDYVIAGVQGEIYPIDKKIFAETYEVLDVEKEEVSS
jgi:hypothetical protein